MAAASCKEIMRGNGYGNEPVVKTKIIKNKMKSIESSPVGGTPDRDLDRAGAEASSAEGRGPSLLKKWGTAFTTVALLVPGLSTTEKVGPLVRVPNTATTQRLVSPTPSESRTEINTVRVGAKVGTDVNQSTPNQEGQASFDRMMEQLDQLKQGGSEVKKLVLKATSSDEKTIGAPDPYNQQLAAQRAEELKAALIAHGIDPSVIRTTSEEIIRQPGSNPTEAELAEDRGATLSAEVARAIELTSPGDSRFGGLAIRTVQNPPRPGAVTPPQRLPVEEGVLPEKPRLEEEVAGKGGRQKGGSHRNRSKSKSKRGGSSGGQMVTWGRAERGSLTGGSRSLVARDGGISGASRGSRSTPSWVPGGAEGSGGSGRSGAHPKPIEVSSAPYGSGPEGTVWTLRSPSISAPKGYVEKRRPEVAGRELPGHQSATRHQKQPRPANYNQGSGKRREGDRMGRTKGGSRSGKRG